MGEPVGEQGLGQHHGHCQSIVSHHGSTGGHAGAEHHLFVHKEIEQGGNESGKAGGGGVQRQSTGGTHKQQGEQMKQANIQNGADQTAQGIAEEVR